MSSLWQRAISARKTDESRSSLSFNEFVDYFNFNGSFYPFGPNLTMGKNPEEYVHNFEGYVSNIYRSNGVVYACVAARTLLFSEARFQFQQIRNGRPGDLFGTGELGIVEQPWTNGTTRELLTRALQDTDLSGNFFCAREGNTLRRLRPDWVSVISGSKTSDSPNAPDAEVLGYVYHVDGPGNGESVTYMPEEVAHWAPVPDPRTRFLGMPWLTPVIREIMADSAATSHKLSYFENAATPNMAITFAENVNPDTAQRFIERFREDQEGAANAYKTLFMGGAAKIDVVGANLQQMDFKVTQGAGETRIAAAAGVPPIIVGLSEGLAASTYSNYAQARRRFADGTMRPLWGSFCAAMENIVRVPNGSRLWYDDRDVSFLQEDQQDAATIQQTKSVTIHTLITAGFEPDSVIAAVESGDYGLLTHSGLYSVQLQAAGTVTQGKGALDVGTVVPAGQKQLPAPKKASAADVLAALHRN